MLLVSKQASNGCGIPLRSPCCSTDPSQGLCFPMSPSRAHTFIPHEPHATVPALAVRGLGKQLCHRLFQPAPRFPESERFSRAELRGFLQPEK